MRTCSDRRSMGSSSSKPIEISNKIALKGIPPSFDLVAGESWSRPVFFIAAPGSPARYAISMPEGWGGNTVLHPKPSIRGSPMVYAKRRHGKFRIYLPGVLSVGIMPCSATMRYETTTTTTTTEKYCFELMVHHGNTYRNEMFEWQYFEKQGSKGAGAAGSGWQLVRLGPKIKRHVLPPYPGRAPHSQDQAAPPAYRKEVPSRRGVTVRTNSKSASGLPSDAEIVAVLSQGSSHDRSRACKFQYMEGGTTEEMGYHWTLMAAMSGICLWQHQTAKAHYGAP
ncbi:hypothetical protein AK830_g7164 [Neonectria ditissima]|uniref:Uncharacterized protein n=1 Tax=Neonectria ditissima TaxID=78410 RepID=A0A0P7BER7_9HYPO|nr:hypothetical protein AK830_g7164 [Neonectria ditissima]